MSLQDKQVDERIWNIFNSFSFVRDEGQQERKSSGARFLGAPNTRQMTHIQMAHIQTTHIQKTHIQNTNIKTTHIQTTHIQMAFALP